MDGRNIVRALLTALLILWSILPSKCGAADVQATIKKLAVVVAQSNPALQVESKICSKMPDDDDDDTVCRHFITNYSPGKPITPHACKASEQIQAFPKAAHVYYRSDPLECETELTLTVRVSDFLLDLEARGQSAARAGKNGEAALIYNDLVAQWRKADPAKSDELKKALFDSTSKALGLDAAPTTDPEGNIVLGPELKSGIVEYQKQNKINALKPGVLDYSTLRSLAGRDIGDIYMETKKSQ
jgi:hypothetical protein